jgi:hypothetical protein
MKRIYADLMAWSQDSGENQITAPTSELAALTAQTASISPMFTFVAARLRRLGPFIPTGGQGCSPSRKIPRQSPELVRFCRQSSTGQT